MTHRLAPTRRRKRTAAIALAAGVVLLAAGCGQLNADSQSSSASSVPQTTAVQNADSNAQTGHQVTVPGLGTPGSSPASTAVPSSPPPTSSSSAAVPTVSSVPTGTTAVPVAPSTILTTVTHTVTPPPSGPSVAPTTPATVTTTATTTPMATSVVRTTTTRIGTPDPVTVGGGSGQEGGSGPGLPSGTPLAGKVVALDPGHNGDNANHPEIINQKIDGGNGATDNVCNTVGAESNDGYPEHAFNWGVAVALRADLQKLGAQVVMTRPNDTGVGPCTPKRAEIENNSHADAVISIHGDGQSPDSVAGFYVITDEKPLHGTALASESNDLAGAVQQAMLAAGFPANSQVGQDGLFTRSDLTGLNLSTRPKILVECGNMRNPQEAGLMSSASGQAEYALALARGVVGYLS